MTLVASRRGAIGVLAFLGLAWAGLAQAAPISFSVELTGAQQVPPVQTAATGKADLTYDPPTRMVTWSVAYSGLSSPATMAHFHGPAAAGANGPVTLWLSKQGMAPRKPDHRLGDAEPGAGPAIHGGSVVHQRSLEGPSAGRNPRSGDAAQRLTRRATGFRRARSSRRRRRRGGEARARRSPGAAATSPPATSCGL